MDQLQQLSNDYLYTFHTPSGERVLEDLKNSFHVNSPMFQPGLDPMTLSFREGQRSVILWILLTLESILQPEEVQTHSDSDGNEQPTKEDQ